MPNPQNAAQVPWIDPPAMEQIARPQQVERNEPVPRTNAEPTPFTLRQYAGQFPLPRPAADAVRPVTESDIEDIMLWAIPRFTERHPNCTREGMLPLIHTAVQGGLYKLIRTDSACGLFAAAREPWEPGLTVFDIFVVDRDLTQPIAPLTDPETWPDPKSVPWEVVRIYRAGLDWAKSLKAVEFRFAEDNGYPLDVIAKRLEMDSACVLYRKSLVPAAPKPEESALVKHHREQGENTLPLAPTHPRGTVMPLVTRALREFPGRTAPEVQRIIEGWQDGLSTQAAFQALRRGHEKGIYRRRMGKWFIIPNQTEGGA